MLAFPRELTNRWFHINLTGYIVTREKEASCYMLGKISHQTKPVEGFYVEIKNLHNDK